MAKCKYPNAVCANMTVLNGVTYCDSVPCSLKDELPKQTNADRIRNMSDEELAEFLCEYEACPLCSHQTDNMCNSKNCDEVGITLKWLQAEVKEGNSHEST